MLCKNNARASETRFTKFDMYTLRSKLYKAIFGYMLSLTAILVLIHRNTQQQTYFFFTNVVNMFELCTKHDK